MANKLDEETKFNNAQVGELIWCWRDVRGMSQRELAEKAGISVSYLSYLERGTRGMSYSTLKSLTAALGVTPGDLTPKEGKAKL